MNRKVVLSIDVGGTFYKTAVLDSHSFEILEGSLFEHRSYSNENKEKILAALITVVSRGLKFCEESEEKLVLSHIAFDSPGPFDYINGCAVMNHKFQAIYKLRLPPIIRDACNLSDAVPIVYHHDLHAFTYGVCNFGAGINFDSVFCVTIGTGLGTGCYRNGVIEMNCDGTPKYPVFRKPYGKKIVEDIVSNRGLTNAYNVRNKKNPVADAKEIEMRAVKFNDPVAIEVYAIMGTVLGRTIQAMLDDLQIEALIIGGQISKGFNLFGEALRNELTCCKSLKFIGPEKYLDSAAIRGCGALPLSWYEAYSESVV